MCSKLISGILRKGKSLFLGHKNSLETGIDLAVSDPNKESLTFDWSLRCF